MFGEVTVEDLENSLPFWISDHLGDCSFMEIEVKDYPASPKEDLNKPVGGLPIVEDTWSPPEKETNIMTQDELDYLEELSSFLIGVQT